LFDDIERLDIARQDELILLASKSGNKFIHGILFPWAVGVFFKTDVLYRRIFAKEFSQISKTFIS